MSNKEKIVISDKMGCGKSSFKKIPYLIKDKNGIFLNWGDKIHVYGGEYHSGIWELDFETIVDDKFFENFEKGFFDGLEIEHL